jgi:hypothetical protein
MFGLHMYSIGNEPVAGSGCVGAHTKPVGRVSSGDSLTDAKKIPIVVESTIFP